MRGFTCLQCVHNTENSLFDFSKWISSKAKPGERKAVRIFTIFGIFIGCHFHVEDPETYLCRFFELKTDEIGKKGKGIKICELKDRYIIL